MGGAARQMHAKKKKKEKEVAEAAKKAEEEVKCLFLLGQKICRKKTRYSERLGVMKFLELRTFEIYAITIQ